MRPPQRSTLAPRSAASDVYKRQITYRDQDFGADLGAPTAGQGADVILDNMGAKYLARNVTALADGGRLVVIGLQGGARGELDLAALLTKRAAVIATSLRARPPAEKATIVAAVREHVWPLVAAGAVRPVIHERFALADAAAAHRDPAASPHIGTPPLGPRAAARRCCPPGGAGASPRRARRSCHPKPWCRAAGRAAASPRR